MKTYEEMTEEVLGKVNEEKRRRGAWKRISSVTLSLAIVAGIVFAAFWSGGLNKTVVPTVVAGGEISAARDYGEIFDLLFVDRDDDREYSGTKGDVITENLQKTAYDLAADGEYPSEQESANFTVEKNGMRETAAEDDYSKTNVQVDGIDEADVVKTDGRYIYAVSFGNVYIISAENGEMSTLSKIPFKAENGAFSPESTLFVSWGTPDIYIDGDRLIVVARTYKPDEDYGQYKEVDDYFYYMPYYGSRSYYTAAVYDVSDRTAPSLISTVSVSGDGVSSRMTDGKLYLIAADRYYGGIDRNDPSTFIPSVYENGGAELIAPDAIYCGGEESECEYLNLMEVGVSDASVLSSLSLLGYDGETMYQSADNVFVARTNYMYDSSETTEDGVTTSVSKYDNDTVIAKIALDGGLSFAGSARLDGYIHNSFSMDEYDGYLRVVTSVDREEYVSKWREVEQEDEQGNGQSVVEIVYGTDETGEYHEDYYGPDYYYGGIEYIDEVWNEDTYNNLYVLDSAMNVTGKIEGLATGERIYSCRFEGKDGYFVTYRETDPLFHVDLSDPTSPRVVDELKIPGHSDYLERFGDLMFGFGQDDEGLLKLSMFSEDEGGAMSEIAVITIPDAYYSEALYDHHAILADAERGLICFGAETWSGDSGSRYYIVSWNGQSFEIRTAAVVGDWSDAIRGLRIGEYFYLYVRGYSGNSVTSFDLSSFGQIDREELDEPDYEVAVDYVTVID